MEEVLRTTDWVRLSFIQALLTDAGIESVVADEHMSILDGSIMAIPRRIMVLTADATRAKDLISEASRDLA